MFLLYMLYTCNAESIHLIEEVFSLFIQSLCVKILVICIVPVDLLCIFVYCSAVHCIS
jgi:hypothetical protein